MSLSKAQLYQTRIMSVEYDLQGAIEAYGVECVHLLIDEIASHYPNATQYASSPNAAAYMALVIRAIQNKAAKTAHPAKRKASRNTNSKKAA